MKKVIPPKPSKLRKISRKTISVAIILTLISGSLLIFSSSFGLPQGYRPFSVLSGSMEPTLPVGSLIITQRPKQIHEGDIITFIEPRTQDKYITHRVVDIKEENGQVAYITQGDANPSPDAWNIQPDKIEGIYKTHLPYAGTIMQFIKSPLGVVLFILIPTLFIAVLEIKNILKILLEKKIKRLEKIKQDIEKLHKHNYQSANTNYKSNSVKNISSPPIIKKVTIVPLALYLILISGFIKTTDTYSLFKSNTVTISGNTLTVAESFEEETISNNCDLSINSELTNNNTGENSTNTNELNVTQECNIDTENNTNVNNDININVNTGNNSSNNNTSGGNIETGNVNISIGIQN